MERETIASEIDIPGEIIARLWFGCFMPIDYARGIESTRLRATYDTVAATNAIFRPYARSVLAKSSVYPPMTMI